MTIKKPETVEDLKLALREFIGTIEATGGVTRRHGWPVPFADQDWVDLGAAYLLACKALRCKPKWYRRESTYGKG